MSNDAFAVFQAIATHRTTIAILVPLLGSTLALVASIWTPRGKAKGLITGSYMLLASFGGACLLFALISLLYGAPMAQIAPLLLLGVTLGVVMGVFTPAIIREYQLFEGRKLAAGIFRRS
jgi:hypothetical protein